MESPLSLPRLHLSRHNFCSVFGVFPATKVTSFAGIRNKKITNKTETVQISVKENSKVKLQMLTQCLKLNVVISIAIFTRATLCCPSVCPSRAGIVSKRRKLAS